MVADDRRGWKTEGAEGAERAERKREPRVRS
jgi:hypothetical protein